MIKNVNKISIIGGPGSGKSTLARNLGKELNIPVCHIDSIHHLDNWQVRDKQERDKILLEKISEPKWVMDGTYRSTLETRIQHSDCVIFLDYSTIAKVKGILSRYFKNKGKEKPDIPGCKEKMSFTFLWFTAKWNYTKRKQVLAAVERNNDREIVIFKNRRQLNKWYKEEFGKEIEL